MYAGYRLSAEQQASRVSRASGAMRTERAGASGARESSGAGKSEGALKERASSCPPIPGRTRCARGGGVRRDDKDKPLRRDRTDLQQCARARSMLGAGVDLKDWKVGRTAWAIGTCRVC